ATLTAVTYRSHHLEAASVSSVALLPSIGLPAAGNSHRETGIESETSSRCSGSRSSFSRVRRRPCPIAVQRHALWHRRRWHQFSKPRQWRRERKWLSVRRNFGRPFQLALGPAWGRGPWQQPEGHLLAGKRL